MHKRLFYLDNLKTFALLLGVLFHTSIVYAPNVGYAVKSIDSNYFFEIVVHFIHVFRMPLFFFLSGFFSYMVLNKHGGRNFTFSRFERMFAPMIVGLLFFAPIQYYLVYNQQHSPISFFEYYPIFFTSEEFDLSHIWFLVYLFLYSFLLLLNYKFKFLNKFFSLVSFKKIQSIETISNRTPGILFSQNIFICFTIALLTNIFFNKDDSFLRIQPVSFFYYLTYFLIGVSAYKSNLLQEPQISFQTRTKPYLRIIRFLFLFSIFLYLNEIDPYWMNFTYEIKKIFIRALHLLLDSILAWIIIFELSPIFKKYLDHTGPILDHLRNSGMSVYLIHHPISLLIGYNLISLSIPVFFKFILHTLLVYFLSFFLYYYVVKKSFILNRVFGTK